MKPISIHGFKRKALRKNRKGGIEGLPLQLMIIIMIATLGTAIIVGWMGNIEEPHSISNVTVDSGDICLSGNTYSYSSTYSSSSSYKYVNEIITISVFDENGDPLPDATVVLTGLGISDNSGGTVHGNTNAYGNVSFSNVKLKMSGHVGYIDVEVSKAGYGENSSCKITVIA